MSSVIGAALHRQRLAQRIEPRHANLAGGRLGEAQQDQDHRGLAGPVGPQQAEDLALANLQIKPRDGLHAAVALDEIPDHDHGISCRRAAHLRPYRRTPTAITRRAAAMTPSPVAPHKVEVVTVTRKSAELETPATI